MEDADKFADAVIDLGRLALALGRVDRTAVYHPDGTTPESDTDHTVMLGWIACALASQCFPGLNVGIVAEFALVHDAVEAYAGDTSTLRIDDAGRADKETRERLAAERIVAEFVDRLPWFPMMIKIYEAQTLPEARFVRGLDKIMPKIVHLLDQCAGLRKQNMGSAELAATWERQRLDMLGYVGDFPVLMDLRAELVARVLERPELDHDTACACTEAMHAC